MNENSLNISKIETYLNSILDGEVSENTFFTTLPDKTVIDASMWKDMVLVTIPEGIRDFAAYGQGSIFVILYARPFESGKKNVLKMSELEEKLNIVLASAASPLYVLRREDVFADFDDDINWHCNVVELTLTVL